MEEMEEALDTARESMKHMHADISEAADKVERKVEEWTRSGDGKNR
jgi:hypothetical protein